MLALCQSSLLPISEYIDLREPLKLLSLICSSTASLAATTKALLLFTQTIRSNSKLPTTIFKMKSSLFVVGLLSIILGATAGPAGLETRQKAPGDGVPGADVSLAVRP